MNASRRQAGEIMPPEVSILDRTLAALPRLRICVVTETYPPEVNGVALTLARCVDSLRARGHEVVVVRPQQGAAAASASASEFLVTSLPIPGYPGLRMGMPAGNRLRTFWQGWRPDLLHVITEGPLGWSALRTAQAMHIPVVADFHTNFHSYGRHYGWGWLTHLIYRYLRKFHNQAQLTLVPTRGMRDRLAGDGFRRLEVVARGVDVALFHPGRRDAALRARWGLKPDDLAVLYVGRLAAEKNLPVVLDAFAAIRRAQPSARLILVGDGPARAELEASAGHHYFAGIRRSEDLAAHYASADMFLFPSLTETFGNVTLEAMASGLAVIAYDYAAAGEHIVHAESGWLAPFDDPAAFIRGAETLATSPQLRGRVRTAAAATCELLTWDRVVDDLERALVRIVNAEVQALQPALLARRPAAAVPPAGRPLG
jgi:glycosyltransferase involved in cell wall biosynthesis